MASDLIPPPSPAGRPQPVGTPQPAGTPRLVELPPEPTVASARPDPPPPPPPPKLPPSRFRNRFGFMLGGLAGCVVASALVLAVVLSSGGRGAVDENFAPNWSKWQPTDRSLEGGAKQIADHVGAEYKHANGRQLVKVMSGPLGIDVALRPATGPISVISGPGVLYQLNGLGPNGSIKGGTPSESRLQLVRREALELALYTFRYLPDVDMVVTLLPPPPPKKDAATASASTTGLVSAAADPDQLRAVFYRPGDLKDRLQVPLGVTIPAQAPAPEKMGGTEGKTVDQLTLANVFTWSLTRSQDSTPYLVLDREA